MTIVTGAGSSGRRLSPHTIDASKANPIEEIKKFGGADCAICVAVSPKAFEQAFGSLRRGGTAVFAAVGLSRNVRSPDRFGQTGSEFRAQAMFWFARTLNRNSPCMEQKKRPNRKEISVVNYSDVSNLFPVTSSVLLNTTFQFTSKKSTWPSCTVNSLPGSERIIVL
jgi:hypothetical protein